MMEDFKYKETTKRIIGAAMEVHKTLGNGFQEVIYQRELGFEFALNHIRFEREFSIQIKYKGNNIGSRRVDFLVDEVISVELKAVNLKMSTSLRPLIISKHIISK